MGNRDMIRRNDAINAVRTACILNHVPFKSDSLEGQRTLEAIKAVREVPAVPVREDVQGQWLREPSDIGTVDIERCSICGCEMNERNQFWNANFCPNCGARMRGEGND